MSYGSGVIVEALINLFSVMVYLFQGSWSTHFNASWNVL